MAFNLNGIVIDRIQIAIAESLVDDSLLYTLTQLNTATIDTTADTRDAVDANGTLIKRFYQSKAAAFSATNALLDLNTIAGQSGDAAKSIADTGIANSSFTAPKIVILKKSDLAAGAELDLSDLVEGTISVAGVNNNNSIVETYELGSAAAAKKFAVTDAKFVQPTTPDTDVTKYLISYDRTVTKGIKVVNSADDFPSTVKLTLKCLAVDPCHLGELKALYVQFPSFQPSPQVSFELTTDSTFDFTGDAQVDYCSDDKALYILTWADDDVEQEKA